MYRTQTCEQTIIKLLADRPPLEFTTRFDLIHFCTVNGHNSFGYSTVVKTLKKLVDKKRVLEKGAGAKHNKSYILVHCFNADKLQGSSAKKTCDQTVLEFLASRRGSNGEYQVVHKDDVVHYCGPWQNNSNYSSSTINKSLTRLARQGKIIQWINAFKFIPTEPAKSTNQVLHSQVANIEVKLQELLYEIQSLKTRLSW